MGMPGGTELLIIFGIIVLMFGAKKIPDLAKGIGKGIKNFKAEMKEPEEAIEVASEKPKKVETTQEVASTQTPKTTEEVASTQTPKTTEEVISTQTPKTTTTQV